MPWHRPLLAQPGPWREAIHCALLSSFICASILNATCLLLAASLAAGLIKPTLAKVHIACALTAHVDTRRRYWPTMVPRRCSDSCLPVDRQMWATLASAQVWTSAWRSSEPSPQLPTTHTNIQKLTNWFVLNRPKSDHCLALSVNHSLLVEKINLLDFQSYYMDFSKILNVFVKIGTSISLKC